jgi:adenylate cyclase
MFTDMVGSTAAAQTDEKAALLLRDEQEDLVRPLFAVYQGRPVKSTGDGFLVEFESALRAVECAIEIQRSVRLRNGRAKGGRFELRIGIHLGDVEPRGLDIVGDSVNLASRIEPLSEPGGVCISQQVYDQVRNKLPLHLVKLEGVSLKNVIFPIDIYRLTMPWSPGTADESQALDRHRVAVLPLVNLISGTEDEYFADGMTEELISAISKVRGLSVISRTSVMRYKGQSKTASDIGRELRVGTLLEGSVRKAGGRVRIAVQLINAETDEHLWAENYDRGLEDVFAIQSEIAQSVASVLEIALRDDDRKSLKKTYTKDAEAHALYLKGRFAHQSFTDSAFLEAIRYYERAVERDPSYAMAWAWLAAATLQRGFFEFSAPLEAAREGERMARQALTLDPSLPDAHVAVGFSLYMQWDIDGGEAAIDRALELEPNFPRALQLSSFVNRLRRRYPEAEKLARRALELDPLSPESISEAATGLLYLGRLDDAIALYRTVLEINPEAAFARGNMGLALVLKGSMPEGISLMRESRRAESSSVGGIADLGYALGKAGRTAELSELLADTLQRHERTGRLAPAIASIYTSLGDKDRAFEWLEKAFEEHSAYLPTIGDDLVFEGLWSDPRMEPLLARVGLKSTAPQPPSFDSRRH